MPKLRRGGLVIVWLITIAAAFDAGAIFGRWTGRVPLPPPDLQCTTAPTTRDGPLIRFCFPPPEATN